MIERDGTRISIWQDGIPPYTTMNLPEQTHYDVAIIGGGITGIATAWKLQQAGKRCLLLEAETLCFGTTSGTTAHLNTLLDTPYTTISSHFSEATAQLVAKATRQAIDDVRHAVTKLHIDCGFTDSDAFLFSELPEQTPGFEAVVQAARNAGLAIAPETGNPLPIPFDRIVRIGGQARFHPVRYCYTLAKAFEAIGGVIVQHCRVTAVKEETPVSVETSRLNGFTADAVVIATHIPTGVNLLHLRCTPYRSYAMALVLKDPAQYPAALVYDSHDPYRYYRTQEAGGQVFLIAGGEDHKTGHEAHTDGCFDRLEAYVRRYFDVREVAYKWSSQYYESADGLPYIGHLPGHGSNLLVATGFGGNGMVYSHVSAHCLSELLFGREHPYPFFDPNRIKPIAGFRNFLHQNIDVAKQLLSRLIPPEKLTVLSELAHGEARVLRVTDETIALYKDEHGAVHAVDPVCTHLHCEVSWNEVERSWDCPCHGARFSVEGKVLNAPADRNLQQVRLDNAG
ncbi:FAD-dependent oxidoreductase [Sediminibacterium soli]|uniref:FAD-dependent oxidoreductase n=1 Tax=Sediminibacterium soli TaxID=2698829 RepID=UPI00137A73AF|nr:FAD-dependent oxidoreductase [Sediminibacterium soli]NCI46222.1 FAD-dependent oxidoreductase [Sediminibacterium soli]